MRPILLLMLLSACAGSDEPERERIRSGTEPRPDAGTVADAAADFAIEVDATAEPDAGRAPAPERFLWLMVRADRWGDGPRAHFVPTHRPSIPGGTYERARAIVEQLPGAIPVVAWTGPDSPSARLLARFAAEGPTAVYYDADARAVGARDAAARASSDVRTLVIEHLETAQAAHMEDAPVLFLGGDPEGEPLRAVVATLDDLPIQPALMLEVDAAVPVALPEWALGAFPRGSYGFSLSGQTPRSDATDAASLRRWAEGARWLPRLMPPRFRRDGGVQEPPEDGRAFRRAVMLARRAIDPAWPHLMVDGAGGWADDRQLDPIDGMATRDPMFLTQGLEYAAYGDARVAAVAGLLAPAGAPRLEAPELIELHRDTGVRVLRLETVGDGIEVEVEDASGGQGRLEVLLSGSPFTLTPGMRLVYTRSEPSLFVDLVFGDGTRLHDTLEVPEGEQIEVELDGFVPSRVEEVVLIYAGGRNRVRDRLEVRIER